MQKYCYSEIDPPLNVRIATSDTTPKHPWSKDENAKHKLNFYNYKDRCSIWNYLKYVHDCNMGKTSNNMILIKKEAPYTNGMDFMILAWLPPIFLELTIDWKIYQFSTDDKLEDIINIIEKGDMWKHDPFFWETWEQSPLYWNKKIRQICESKITQDSKKKKITKKEKKINKKLKKSKLRKLWKLSPDKAISQDISSVIKLLEENYPWENNAQLKIQTENWLEEITPKTHIWKYAVVSRSDFDKKWETEKKEEIQKFQNAFFKRNNPEKWRRFLAWYNYSETRLDWKDSTWRDGWVNWQSFESFHLHMLELEQWTDKKTLSKQEEDDFHDGYITKALAKKQFDWWDTKFKTLKPVDNRENELSKQWITFNIKKQEYWTDKFREEYSLVVKIIEDLDFGDLKIDDFLYKGWYLPRRAKKIVMKLKYNDSRLNSILKDNEELFIDIIKWVLEREKENGVGRYSRRCEWEDGEKSRVIPFPNFWHSTIIEMDHNWDMTLRICPRIHTKAAIMEANWDLLKRVDTEEEKLKEIQKIQEETNRQVINTVWEKSWVEFS